MFNSVVIFSNFSGPPRIMRFGQKNAADGGCSRSYKWHSRWRLIFEAQNLALLVRMNEFHGKTGKLTRITAAATRQLWGCATCSE